ncbi:hypothetical protein NKH18_48640 [Streptomyces sp. M10(2022)]
MTIKYLEPDFTELFRRAARARPDGSQDTGFHGRELTRNGAVGDHALATGMRLQEFTYLLPWEIPALPPEPTPFPSRSRCRPGSPRARSSAPRGPLTRPWPGCTIMSSWTGLPRRTARSGGRHDGGANR